MSKHTTPRPALFERPETALYIAIAVAGLLVGAIPATPLVTLLIAMVVYLPLGILAILPAPGERAVYVAPSRRRRAVR